MLLLSTDPVSILETLSQFAATEVAPGLRAVGVGIASVFFLVVLFYYLVSILDGGRFQLKMCVPFVVFLFVCNFRWISEPVVFFTSTMTGSIVSGLDSIRGDIAEEYTSSRQASIASMGRSRKAGGDAYAAAVDSYLNTLGGGVGGYADGMAASHALSAAAGGDSSALKKFISERGISVEDTTLVASHDAEAYTEGSERAGAGMIRRGIARYSDGVADRVYAETDDGAGVPDDGTRYTLLGIVAAVISFVCRLIGVVLRSLGAVMTAVIVAFGPITFAFAILPGQAGTIKSWFIRLCQFALYAPITALLDAFSYKLFAVLGAATGTSSVLMTISVLVCNLVCLTSVPSIASMIVEGAQGAISLSQGLQTVAGALTGGMTVAQGVGSAGATAVLGKDRITSLTQPVRDAFAGGRQMGMAGLGKSVFGQGGSFKGAFREARDRGASMRGGAGGSK